VQILSLLTPVPRCTRTLLPADAPKVDLMASLVAESSRQLIVDTQRALTSSRRAVATSRARLSHAAPVLQPARPGSQARPVVLDPGWSSKPSSIAWPGSSSTHRHSPTAPQRYPPSARRPTVIDEPTASTSCEQPWTSGNARSPPPQRPPNRYHPHRRRSVARRPPNRSRAGANPSSSTPGLESPAGVQGVDSAGRRATAEGSRQRRRQADRTTSRTSRLCRTKPGSVRVAR